MNKKYLYALQKNRFFPLKDFFQISSEGNIVGKRNIIVYDLETTGIDPIFDDITQIAYCVFSPTFKLLYKTNVYCNLELKQFEEIDPEIIKKTKITKELLNSGVKVKKAISNFLNKAAECIILSYNGWGFDDKFITAKIYRYIHTPFWPSIFMSDIDVMLLAIGVFFKKTERMGLESVAKMLNISFKGTSAHNAFYDVAKTSEVFLGTINALFNDNPLILNECILRYQKKCLKRWKFKRYDEPWPATIKQLDFVKRLLDSAYRTKGLKGLLEWVLFNVLEENVILNYLKTSDQTFVQKLSKIEAGEIISFLKFLENIGIFKFHSPFYKKL